MKILDTIFFCVLEILISEKENNFKWQTYVRWTFSCSAVSKKWDSVISIYSWPDKNSFFRKYIKRKSEYFQVLKELFLEELGGAFFIVLQSNFYC